MHLEIFRGKCVSSLKKCIFISLEKCFVQFFANFSSSSYTAHAHYLINLNAQGSYTSIIVSALETNSSWSRQVAIPAPLHDYSNGGWSVSLSLPTSRYRHYIVDCHLIEVHCIRAIFKTILTHRHFSEKRSKGSLFSVLLSSQFNKWHAQNKLLYSTLICLLS
jgi:hypothetical protein